MNNRDSIQAGGASAGNLNEALKVTDGEYVAPFDADHVPTRSFLQVSLGWFLKDPKLAMPIGSPARQRAS